MSFTPTCVCPLATKTASGSEVQEARGDQQLGAEATKRTSSIFMATSGDDFKSEYIQCSLIGQGGFGNIYAGQRAADSVPVAIKYVPKKLVKNGQLYINGEPHMVPNEVLLMLIAAGGPESKGKSAAITLLDWCDLDKHIVLVMERPVNCRNLINYMDHHPLQEAVLKDIMRQLVDAAIYMHSVGVFHQDIKCDNILIEEGKELNNVRVRVIDFGSGHLTIQKQHSLSGTVSYKPPKTNKQKIYEGSPTTVWQLGGVLYDMLVGSKRFNTQLFLLDESTFFDDLKELNVTEDCLNFLRMCLNINSKERLTLEELRLHPLFEYPHQPPPLVQI